MVSALRLRRLAVAVLVLLAACWAQEWKPLLDKVFTNSNISYSDGSKYRGNLTSDTKLKWWGVFYDTDDNSYCFGKWANNKLDECGMCLYANGDNSKYGVISYTDGSKYVGETKNGTADGHGVLLWTNGDAWYGHRSNGNRSGEGIYLWHNGTFRVETCNGNSCSEVTSPGGSAASGGGGSGGSGSYSGGAGGSSSFGTFKDSRDGKTYKTVNVGDKTWMAQNLNYAADGSKCYDNNAGNCDKYGRLYDWNTAMKACPAGWRLARDEEWTALVNYAGGESTAGTKLKSTSGWSNNGNGTDNYGFAALPGGLGNSAGNFNNAGDGGCWWSSTELDAYSAWGRGMGYGRESVYRDDGTKTILFSVRCVQSPPVQETRPVQLPPPPSNTFTDSRDGKVYRKVNVGGKTWMAQNLNYAASGSKCYENNAGNCDKYGRLYDWNTAMKACPVGWHLATDAEWTALVDYAGGESTAGTKLKSSTGWNSKSGVPAGTDNYGFSALPGGYGSSGGNFYGAGVSGDWWSATEDDAGNARSRNMIYYEYVNRGSNDKTRLYSVRCAQDVP
jgi:uncharacterized protein (TIGR02145 family)